MKDEIKEILDRLDYNEWEVDLYKVPITWTELYNIRDYITNLEEKIKQVLKILKSEDGSILYYQIIEYAIEELERGE